MNSILLISYIIAAAIPALAVYFIYYLDLFGGTGKFNMVLLCLGWGAIVAFNAALEINTFFLREFDLAFEDLSRFVAPFTEEILKSIILIILVTRPRFRYLVDGAIYGFAAGVGFAVWENFHYLRGAEDAALILAISRVLSASLMHATASSLIGIAFGRLRRSSAPLLKRYTEPVVAGLIPAILVHMGYNSAVQADLPGQVLLLIGITIGIGGAMVIGYIINRGLSEEKERFGETLGLEVGVTDAERKVVQELGSNAMEDILQELGEFFGAKKVDQIRRLLVTQANIGILSNNLRSPSSDRMKEAWQKEIGELREEGDRLRNDIGVYVMSFIRGIFPDSDVQMWDAVTTQIADYDPGHVHKFDIFLRVSQDAGTFDAKRLEKLGASLKFIDIFKRVELADLENLSRAIVEREFEDGELLFNQGDKGDAMYLIDEGAINIYVVDEEIGEKFIRTYQAGSVVGEMALLDGQPRSASARAHGQLKALILRRQHFMMFVNSRPHVIIAVLRFLVDRVRYTTKVVEETIGKASDIAQGNYEALWDLKPDEPTPDTQTGVIRLAQTTMAGATVSLDSSDSLAQTSASLGGAFAMLAVALENREAALQDEAKKKK